MKMKTRIKTKKNKSMTFLNVIDKNKKSLSITFRNVIPLFFLEMSYLENLLIF